MDSILVPRAPSLLDPSSAAAISCLVLADRLEGGWNPRWSKALRSCGRAVVVKPDGSLRANPLFCNLKICPLCRIRRQWRRFHGLRDRVAAVIGGHGAALHLTLSGPHSQPLAARIRIMLDLVRGYSRTHAWKNPHGLSRQVGAIWAFELSLGRDRRGHPHIHQLVVAPEADAVRRYRDSILRFWAAGVHGFSLECESARELSADPDDWGPPLRYILKGSEVDPQWPSEVFDEAILELTSGRNHIGRIGLLHPRCRGGR